MFDTFKCGIFSKIKVQGVQNDQNCSYGLIAPKLPHLISHKIWVAAKFLNFHNLNRKTRQKPQQCLEFHP